MAKTKISQYDATAANNTDIDSINIAEGMAPSNVNNAIRELMAHLKDMDAGTQALTSPQLTSADIDGGTLDGVTIGGASAGAGTFTNLTATGTTTLAGAEISGTLTSDGLTVDDAGTIQLTKNTSAYQDSLGIVEFHDEDGNASADAGKFQLQAFRGGDKDAPDFKLIGSDSTGVLRDRIQVEGNGDISFYEDTGTTAKLHWSAADERLGIGTSSPSSLLHVNGNTPVLTIRDTRSKTWVSGETLGTINFASADASNTPTNIAQINIETDDGSVGTYTAMTFSTATPSALSEAMRIDSSGNVTIKAPTASGGGVLNLENTTAAVNGTDWGSINFISNDTSSGASGIRASVVGTSTSFNGDGNLVFSTAPSNGANTEAMRIDSSGNVGIGSSTANHFSTGGTTNVLGVKSTSGGLISVAATGTSFSGIDLGTDAIRRGGMYSLNGSHLTFYTNGSNSGNTLTERMRIDSSGNLLVGTTSSAGKVTVYTGSGVGQQIQVFEIAPTVMQFRNSQNLGGSITIASGGGTSYNTSSDYRLKEDVQPMVGASDRLMALKPVNFAWKADGSRVDGFLAHEVQGIVPEAVTGAKDAMRDEEYEVTPAVLDDDGNVVTEAVMGTRSVPDYQGIDQSKLVPLLVATIQELEARITALENA